MPTYHILVIAEQCDDIQRYYILCQIKTLLVFFCFKKTRITLNVLVSHSETEVPHLEKQIPQLSEEEDMLSQVNPQVSKLRLNAGTDTVSVCLQWYDSVCICQFNAFLWFDSDWQRMADQSRGHRHLHR